MVSLLHEEHEFSDRFIAHMLSRNLRVEADLVIGPSLVSLAKKLELLVKIMLGRIHGRGEMFGLLGQLGELRHRVLAGIGVRGASAGVSRRREADDGHRHLLANTEFRHDGGKRKDFASFDCRRQRLRRTACPCALLSVRLRKSNGFCLTDGSKCC